MPRVASIVPLRWQVELLFKRWKSLCGFDRLPNYLDETILAWMYAKVLLALLMEQMASSALSPPKDSATTPRQRQLTAHSPAVEASFVALASDDVRLASTWAA